MLVYDRQARAWYDDETGEWAEAPDAPMSAGQAFAALALLPLVIIWVCDQYGLDLLALLGLPGV